MNYGIKNPNTGKIIVKYLKTCKIQRIIQTEII